MNVDRETLELVGLVGYGISHVVAIFGTPSWLPSPVKKIIDYIAGNYAKAKNLPQQQ